VAAAAAAAAATASRRSGKKISRLMTIQYRAIIAAKGSRDADGCLSRTGYNINFIFFTAARQTRDESEEHARATSVRSP